jgi:hypothetical protein
VTRRSWGSPQTFAAPFADRPDYGDPPEDDEPDVRRLTRGRASAFCSRCGHRVSGQYCAVMIHLRDHS